MFWLWRDDGRYRISNPAGDRVLVTGYVGDVEVYSQRQRAREQCRVRIQREHRRPCSEGRHEIDWSWMTKRWATVINSGGRLLFPSYVVTIGNELAANACYGPNQVPNPTVSVDDVDQGPSIAREVVEDGCGRTLVVRDRQLRQCR